MKRRYTLFPIMLVLSLLFGVTQANANPGAGVKYLGYDWLDSMAGLRWLQVGDVDTGADVNDRIPLAIQILRDQIDHKNNMNVVHSIDALRSTACANRNCVLNIQAGFITPK